MTATKLRASNLNIAAHCPLFTYEAVNGRLPTDETKSNVATIGTAVHAALDKKVKSNELVDLDNIALEFNIGIKQLSYLFFPGLNRMDFYFDQGYEIVSSEAELENDLLTGHCDLVMKHLSGSAIMLDWKTGVVSDCYPQLMGYAMLAGEEHSLDGTIYTVGEFIREQETVTAKTTANEAREYVENIIASADLNKACVGAHCTYCPIKRTCQAYTSNIADAGRELMAISGSEVAKPLPDLYEEAKLLGKALEDYFNAIKTMVNDAGGELQRSDGRIFTFKTSAVKKFNLTSESRSTLENQGAGIIDYLIETTEFSKTALNKVPKEYFFGAKGKAVNAIIDELEQRELINFSERKTLQLV